MFPRISGGRIWLPLSVETTDGGFACGLYELPPDDPNYEAIKEWLEQVERGERSLFPATAGELDHAEIDRFKDAWQLPPPRRSEA